MPRLVYYAGANVARPKENVLVSLIFDMKAVGLDDASHFGVEMTLWTL